MTVRSIKKESLGFFLLRIGIIFQNKKPILYPIYSIDIISKSLKARSKLTAKICNKIFPFKSIGGVDFFFGNLATFRENFVHFAHLQVLLILMMPVLSLYHV
jgi:hypothetical protein